MNAIQIVDQWLHVPTLKLRAGEMTAQESRTVQAVLRGLRADLVRQMATPAEPVAQAAGSAVSGASDPEPPLRWATGETNRAWIDWYRLREGCNLQDAIAAYNQRVKAADSSASQGNLPAVVPGST